ncbi:hypothetical protein [Endozoicomonas sp. GU-1]|uniref:hypothetical protein n=1 Tax=Endozoicomonas sp. GU-1 TaxID=3009078 RepID=UPI0022B40FD7|nr:hypothetical protein [Endozoicomonas sp. GU-1]WBA84273.1 hypothetical protein O3276_13260 [Endozoicomonas sp. GU-1]
MSSIRFSEEEEAFQLANVALKPCQRRRILPRQFDLSTGCFSFNPNNPFSNRTSWSAMMIHPADPWVTVSGLPVEERRILHKPNVMTSIFIPG